MRLLLMLSFFLSLTGTSLAQQSTLADNAQAYLDEAVANGQCIGIAAGMMTGDSLRPLPSYSW